MDYGRSDQRKSLVVAEECHKSPMKHSYVTLSGDMPAQEVVLVSPICHMLLGTDQFALDKHGWHRGLGRLGEEAEGRHSGVRGDSTDPISPTVAGFGCP